MQTLTPSKSTACGAKAAMLRRLQTLGFRVPEFVVSPLDVPAALARLGVPVVVRSSANVEDAERTSFAGQFSSFLGLSTAAEVEDAIEQCHQSARSAAVVSYCQRAGIDPKHVQMEVIVQRMIEPELAGVAFTVNPLTGAEQVVIEACAGLADGLLAGREQPLPDGHPLVERYRGQIERTAREIQRFLGSPQDIEFAIEDQQLYILQSRPITRISFVGQEGEWTTADFRDGGVSSGVCSPLMWSLYELVWDQTLKQALRELKLFREEFQAGRMFFGRPYWNVGAVKQCLLELPGFVERDFDKDLSIEITYRGDGRRTPMSLGGILRALPTLAALPRFFRSQEQVDTRLLAHGFEAIGRKYEPPGIDPVTAFGELVHNEFFTIESNYFRTIFAASLAKMDFTSAFPQADYASLVAALPPLRHLEPVHAVERLSRRDDEALSALVDQYRHHYRLGLDICCPRWDEDRQFVMQMLRDLPPVNGRQSHARTAYQAARAAAAARVPRWKRRKFHRKLDRLRKLIWLREEMRDLSNRMYHLLRRQIVEIGRQRGIGDDIYFMTFRDIISDDRSGVERNREIYESYRNFKAPNEIGARYHVRQSVAPRGKQLLGIGASPGTATGRAHIARSVSQALPIEPGAILVCPFTDPGWTPVLQRAAGVVTETGGLLSHAAVICRECGIPAVLGVVDATSRIRSGEEIVVDASRGCIELADMRIED